MRIVLLGAPGAGKGTLADFISKTLQIPKISTGDMLRAEIASNTEIGQAVKKVMSEGGLVPEDVIIKLLQDRVSQADCHQGFLLDGFPRTVKQAESLKASGLEIDRVIELEVSDAEIIKRLSGRRVHLASGRIYHIEHNPPRKAALDDITGEPLIQREDDKEETIRKRLKIYHENILPLTAWYQTQIPRNHYVRISGQGSMEEVRRQFQEAINGHRQAH